jgi:hypothetical protein
METQHAELGASNAERWMVCAGSVALSRGLPDIPSKYAEEGTLAHQYAEQELWRVLNEQCGVPAPALSELDEALITEDMCEAVDVFVLEVMETLKRERTPDVRIWVEHKFSLNALNPPAKMFGTADAVVYLPKAKRLVVLDYKHGAGVIKEAAGNPQPRYYALGALLEIEQQNLEYRGEIDTIESVIIQPRAPHLDGIVRREVIGYDDLLAFSIDLLNLAKATLDPNAPLVPGPHCRFCRAAGACPALQAEAQAVAQVEFAALPTDVPPDPATLSDEFLAHILNNADILEDWLAAVRANVFAKLERGVDVPGWKLVPKRGRRQWSYDEQHVTNAVIALGLELDECYAPPKIRSVTQMEKALKAFKQKLHKNLYEMVSSGSTLAPAADSRPAIAADPVLEFTALPPGELTTSQRHNDKE